MTDYSTSVTADTSHYVQLFVIAVFTLQYTSNRCEVNAFKLHYVFGMTLSVLFMLFCSCLRPMEDKDRMIQIALVAFPRTYFIYM